MYEKENDNQENKPYALARERNECIKSKLPDDEQLKPPVIMKCFSENFTVSKEQCKQHDTSSFINCCEDTSLEMESDEIQEEVKPQATKPKTLPLKRFYSEGIYLNPYTQAIKTGEHLLRI